LETRGENIVPPGYRIRIEDLEDLEDLEALEAEIDS
jgi:hypothetical protein